LKRRKCSCRKGHVVLLTLFLATASALTAWASPQFSRGATVFKANCSYCHGSDATGSTALGKSLGAANLHARAIQKLSDSTLKMIIAHGSGRMPSFGLSDAELTLLISYLREISGSKNMEEVRSHGPWYMRPWVGHHVGA
jgi:mono/diheme cytochrome c family protein